VTSGPGRGYCFVDPRTERPAPISYDVFIQEIVWRKYALLTKFVYHVLSFLNIKRVLCLFAGLSNFRHSIRIVSCADMKRTFFDRLPFFSLFVLSLQEHFHDILYRSAFFPSAEFDWLYLRLKVAQVPIVALPVYHVVFHSAEHNSLCLLPLRRSSSACACACV
jgi:hypothetical protein